MFTFIFVFLCIVLLILLGISILDDMLFSGNALYVLLPCSLFLSILLFALANSLNNLYMYVIYHEDGWG